MTNDNCRVTQLRSMYVLFAIQHQSVIFAKYLIAWSHQPQRDNYIESGRNKTTVP
jgi:phage shock protein PspC (stress-responsive transcriptional regulator)